MAMGWQRVFQEDYQRISMLSRKRLKSAQFLVSGSAKAEIRSGDAPPLGDGSHGLGGEKSIVEHAELQRLVETRDAQVTKDRDAETVKTASSVQRACGDPGRLSHCRVSTFVESGITVPPMAVQR
jgi:hypothetical protein